jgi:hypothetical protein
MMSNLIIPCAGESTRFPDMRPKWMLAHPNGEYMFIASIEKMNLDRFDNIYVVVLAEHIFKYHCFDGIRKSFEKILKAKDMKKLKIITLSEKTDSQPETVAMAIEEEQIRGPIFIKDADSYFDFDDEITNGVCTYNLHDTEMIVVNNKSYVTVNDGGMITNIVEKRVASPDFCVGGYMFDDASEFLQNYYELQNQDGLYISHIIYNMLLKGNKFKQIKTNVYEDWGTLESWNKYKETFRTLFIDLDGTLVYSSAPYSPPFWGETLGIKKNIEYIRELYNTGRVQIIITTARTEEYREVTERQLKREEIPYDHILFGMLHTKRTIINDYAKSNKYPSCDAVNIIRDTNNLEEYL